MNDRDERPSDVLADTHEQEGEPQRDDDPTAGASDIGGRAGEPEDDDDAGPAGT